VAGEVHFVTSEPLLPGAAVQRGAGLLRLTAIAPTDRDTRARVAREVAAAEANLAALELRVTRNQALIDQGAGTPVLSKRPSPRVMSLRLTSRQQGRGRPRSHATHCSPTLPCSCGARQRSDPAARSRRRPARGRWCTALRAGGGGRTAGQGAGLRGRSRAPRLERFSSSATKRGASRH
jgi:hypothetical protein